MRLTPLLCFSLAAHALPAEALEHSVPVPAVVSGRAVPTLPLPAVAVPPQSAEAALLIPSGEGAPQAGAPVSAQQQLEVARAALAPTGERGAGDSENRRAAAETFWSGERAHPAASEPVAAAASPAPAAFGRLSRFAGRSVVAAAAVAVAIPSPAAAASLPYWAHHVWEQASPYLGTAAGLGATYYAGRLASWAVTTLGNRWGWDQHRIVAVRLAVSVATWMAGASLTLHLAGVSTQVLVSSLGLGGVTLAVGAKEFLRQMLEGVKVLVYRPFFPGDRLIIDKKLYKVSGFTLRYLELGRYGKSMTLMTYAILSGKMVTILRRYAPTSGYAMPRPQGWRDSWSAVRGEAQQDLSLRKTTAWMVAGVVALLGLPYLRGLLHTLPFFDLVFPWVEGGTILFATRLADHWVYSFLGRIADRAEWRPQTTMFVRLGSQILVYAIGGTLALHALGATWTTVAATVGVTSFVVGWATGDLVSNVIQGFLILYSRPFGVGDVLEVGDITGQVVDMNLQYVVLQHSDKTHTLVPYSVLRDSQFTVLDPSEADTRPPQPDPDANTPPAARPQPRTIAPIDALTKQWLAHSAPFSIGDSIRVGAEHGVVVELNADHVVLEREDSSRVQIPFAVLRDSGFSRTTAAAATPGKK